MDRKFTIYIRGVDYFTPDVVGYNIYERKIFKEKKIHYYVKDKICMGNKTKDNEDVSILFTELLEDDTYPEPCMALVFKSNEIEEDYNEMKLKYVDNILVIDVTEMSMKDIKDYIVKKITEIMS